MNWKTVSVYAVLAVVVGLTAIFGGAVVTASAAQSALPGTALYEVKTGLEEAQIALSWDEARQVQLQLAFAEKRLDEVAQLIQVQRFDELPAVVAAFDQHIAAATRGLSAVAAHDPGEAQRLMIAIMEALARYAASLTELYGLAPTEAQPSLAEALHVSERRVEVEFEGTVSSIGPELWEIELAADGSLVAVAITEQTEVEAGVAVGDTVKVEALTAEDGSFVALEIERADGGSPGDEDHNGNLNQNENENQNENLNENQNENENDNESENLNENRNENENQNENENENQNENENEHESDD